jgi:hypothetical protein
MKNIKKVAVLALGAFMSASVFSGCSNNGTTLYNAINKTQTMKASEVQSDITLNISAANLSPQEQMVQTVLPMINSSKLSILTKNYKDEDNTAAQMESDMKLTGPMQLDMGLWVNVDTTKDKPVIKEIYKMPEILTAQLPGEFKGKDYMIMDVNEMANVQGSPQIDYKKLAEFSKEFQPKLLEFMAKYSGQFNSDLNIINKVDSKYITKPNITQHVDIYEVKLNDKTFKDLMHYTLNNFANNKDAMTFLKDYMTSVTSVMGLTEEQAKQSQEELNKTFDNLQEQMPQMITQLNKELDTLNDVKILGDKGIAIQYAINDEGYIVNEKGDLEFVINMADLSKLNQNSISEKENQQKPTGIYTIDLNFNDDIRAMRYNEVTFPQVYEYNSFNYADLLKTTIKQNSQAIIK